MSLSNHSISNPTTFLLIGIPGLEAAHLWISIPFSLMYIIALLGNCTILCVVKVDESLHEPMYYFLSMLAVIDLIFSTSVGPKMLSIFWLKAQEIGFEACFTQMFFIHTFTAVESGVLLAMSFDRYVAICDPLRYTTILTNPRIVQIGMLSLTRGVVVMTPLTCLLASLPYCKTNIIPHSYCEHMAIVEMACDTTVSNIYGLTIGFLVLLMDSLFIILSYVLIIRAVLRLASIEARLKTFGTCVSHICAILAFYTPIVGSSLTHRFGHSVSPHIHILLANFYLLVPPMLNPIVYGVRTKTIRQRVFRMVSLGKHYL
uniref:Olfactory receptor n=1 Tax=Sphenodon punctatus TaxID=8508 RepID=A0A8D0G1C0_SPHPU